MVEILREKSKSVYNDSKCSSLRIHIQITLQGFINFKYTVASWIKVHWVTKCYNQQQMITDVVFYSLNQKNNCCFWNCVRCSKFLIHFPAINPFPDFFGPVNTKYVLYILSPACKENLLFSDRNKWNFKFEYQNIFSTPSIYPFPNHGL